MPRPPKLRKKNGYWMTKAGGTETYFGRTDETSHQEAKDAFAGHLSSLSEGPARRTSITCMEVCDRHLEWVKKHKADATYRQRKYLLQLWCDSEIASGSSKLRTADRPCLRINQDHLQSFLDHLESRKLGLTTQRAAQTAVKACWNWASFRGLLPKQHRPFAGMPKVRVPLKDLREEDLLTDDEIDVLFQHADDDLCRIRGDNGRYRQRLPDEYRRGDENPYRGFEDLLRCYYHTGARTSELTVVKVRDVLVRKRAVVLGKHKRSRTEREESVRQIILNDESFAIFRRHAKGKPGDAYVFTQSNGSPWDKDRLADRFSKIRKLAKVRSAVTIYSFRHLWISEMMMNGVDVATTAKMAGTSIKMIEKVYGHFRNEHLAEAQRKLDKDRERRRNAKKPKSS